MTWTIQNGNKLEITACKASEGLVWKRLLRDETMPDGEEVNNPAVVEDFHQQLAQLKLEQVWLTTICYFKVRADLLGNLLQVVESEESRNKIYNFQELEDCDDANDSEFYFYATNGLGKKGTKINLSGRRWLFNLAQNEPETSSFCLTHDVDALIWKPIVKDEGTEINLLLEKVIAF